MDNKSVLHTSKSFGALRKPGLIAQPPDQRNCSVGQEFEAAATLCRDKVNKFAAQFRSRNRKFRDLEFDIQKDPYYCVHSLSSDSAKFNPPDSLRPSQIHDNPKFMIDGFQSGNIIQGNLGNCWFLSALATLASMPHLIEKICVARDELIGIYGFVFCRDGKWVDIIIDDQLYVNVPKWESLSRESKLVYHDDSELYESIARKGNKIIYFARSSQEGEVWVSLIEKAYAKFYGNYGALNGGEAFDALEDLTGGVSQLIYPHDIFDKDEFWNCELLQATKDRLFGCSIEPVPTQSLEDETMDNGLVMNHSYSILKAIEYNGKRFLKIRSPWGESEWKGRWSDGSKEWSKEWLPVLDLLNHQFGMDGSFIMEYNDFLKTWTSIERTLLMDQSLVKSWLWLAVKNRPYGGPWHHGDISFTFTVSQASPCVIVLSQAESRSWKELIGPISWMFDYTLFKRGDNESLGSSENSMAWPRTVSLSETLQAGEYVLHVRLCRMQDARKRYMKDIRSWDENILIRVRARLAQSMAMAANCSYRQWGKDIIISPDLFTGKNVLELEKEVFEASMALRKLPKRPTVPKNAPTETEKNASNSNRGLLDTRPPLINHQSWHATNPIRPHEEQAYPASRPITPLEDKESPTFRARSRSISRSISRPISRSVSRPFSRPNSPPPQGYLPNHLTEMKTVVCDGCENGLTFSECNRCLACDHNFCDSCVASPDTHHDAKEHPIVRLSDSDDLMDLDPAGLEDFHPLLLCLRVFSQEGAEVSINGQLRHGAILSWGMAK